MVILNIYQITLAIESRTYDRDYLIKAEGNRMYPTANLYGKSKIHNEMRIKKGEIKFELK